MKVKICGITNLDDAKNAIACQADALGFVFYPKSKRYIEPAKAEKIISQLPLFTFKVGVFVNKEPEEINTIINKTKINIVQLHGDETPDIINEINCPVIKTFNISSNFDYNVLNDFHNSIFLLDSGSKQNRGGTGKTFNWELIPPKLFPKIILAGGISIDNIEKLFELPNLPMAIDLSSSIEKSEGKKDLQKMTMFFSKLNYLRSKC